MCTAADSYHEKITTNHLSAKNRKNLPPPNYLLCGSVLFTTAYLHCMYCIQLLTTASTLFRVIGTCLCAFVLRGVPAVLFSEIRTCLCTCDQHALLYSHVNVCTCIHVLSHKYLHICTHTHTCMYPRTHTHTHTHSRTHTHTNR